MFLSCCLIFQLMFLFSVNSCIIAHWLLKKKGFSGCVTELFYSWLFFFLHCCITEKYNRGGVEDIFFFTGEAGIQSLSSSEYKMRTWGRKTFPWHWKQWHNSCCWMLVRVQQRCLSGENYLRSASSLLLAFFNAFPPGLRRSEQSYVKVMKISRCQSIGRY